MAEILGLAHGFDPKCATESARPPDVRRGYAPPHEGIHSVWATPQLEFYVSGQPLDTGGRSPEV